MGKFDQARQVVSTIKAAVNAEREIEKCPHCKPLLDEIKACAQYGHVYRKSFAE